MTCWVLRATKPKLFVFRKLDGHRGEMHVTLGYDEDRDKHWSLVDTIKFVPRGTKRQSTTIAHVDEHDEGAVEKAVVKKTVVH